MKVHYFQLLIAKFKLKLKKVGKTTRPFRYDLNQIPYDYTVEVTNRFKGLDAIECLKIHGQRFITLYRRQWPKPSQRKCKTAKWLSEEDFQIAEKRREIKGKGEREKIFPTECRDSKNSKKRQESLLKWTVQRNRGKQ